jgi:hypothetical protein
MSGKPPKKPCREQTSLKASNENPEAGQTRSERHTFLSKKRGSKTPNPGSKNSDLNIKNFETRTTRRGYTSDPEKHPHPREGDQK